MRRDPASGRDRSDHTFPVQHRVRAAHVERARPGDRDLRALRHQRPACSSSCPRSAIARRSPSARACRSPFASSSTRCRRLAFRARRRRASPRSGRTPSATKASSTRSSSAGARQASAAASTPRPRPRCSPAPCRSRAGRRNVAPSRGARPRAASACRAGRSAPARPHQRSVHGSPALDAACRREYDMPPSGEQAPAPSSQNTLNALRERLMRPSNAALRPVTPVSATSPRPRRRPARILVQHHEQRRQPFDIDDREDLDVAARLIAPAGDGERPLGLREQAVIADRLAFSNCWSFSLRGAPFRSAFCSLIHCLADVGEIRVARLAPPRA